MNELPYSASCERNKNPILAVLEQVLPRQGLVLEIGSCTGQHIVHFAAALPGITWQPSDQAEYLPGLASRIREQGTDNILEALQLDVTKPWPELDFDAAYSANTAHIMDWPAVCAMFAGIGARLPDQGLFCLYGPYNEKGAFTSRSNEQFDRSLRTRDTGMGIRDMEALEKLARGHNLNLEQQFRLPANNSLLVFRKTAG